MAKKYKIHEVAKDFDIQSKFIIENLSKHFEGEKKSQTALEEKELDFIFDVITKENSVKSFDDNFNAVLRIDVIAALGKPLQPETA